MRCEEKRTTGRRYPFTIPTGLITLLMASCVLAPGPSHAAASGASVGRASTQLACGRDPRSVPAGHHVQVRARLGGDVAVLTGRAGHRGTGFTRLLHGHVSVHLAGGAAEHYRVKPVAQTIGRGALLSPVIRPGHYRDVFCLVHLAGASSPVAALTTYSGYNQCCLDLTIFSGTASDRSALHAETVGASLAVRHDSVLVKTADPRFTAAFTDYADTAWPLQFRTVHDGRLVDSTQEFPGSVRRDAQHWWRQFVHPRNGPNDGLGALAAWVADRYVLHDGAAAWERVHRLRRAGRLRGIRGWPHGKVYVHELHRFLVKTGYAH